MWCLTLCVTIPLLLSSIRVLNTYVYYLKWELFWVVASIQIMTCINFSCVFGRRKCEHHQRKSAGYLWPGSRHLLQKLIFVGNCFFFFFLAKLLHLNIILKPQWDLNLFLWFSSCSYFEQYGEMTDLYMPKVHLSSPFAHTPPITLTEHGDKNFTYNFMGTNFYFLTNGFF